jgi:hypothetical protein
MKERIQALDPGIEEKPGFSITRNLRLPSSEENIIYG